MVVNKKNSVMYEFQVVTNSVQGSNKFDYVGSVVTNLTIYFVQ